MSELTGESIRYAVANSTVTIHQKADAIKELNRFEYNIKMLRIQLEEAQQQANEANKEHEQALNKHIVSFSEERAEVCDVCNNSIYTSEFGAQVRTRKCHKCGK